MANTLLTIDMVTREAVRLWRNSNAFMQSIPHQYDDQFARSGAQIGQSLRVRLPNDYVVRHGAAASVQDTSEQSITLALATQAGVDISFSSAEKTLKLDDYSERYLAPAVNAIAGDVAADIMSGVESGVCNFVSNVDGAGAITSPTAQTVLNGGAALTMNSARTDKRNLVMNPFTMAKSVNNLSGLLNPAPELSKQYRTAQIYRALNYMWMEDQTVISHTTGSFTAGTVNGAGQSGLNLVTNAITGTLKKGDIITIAGVNAVNRITKRDTGQLRQFVVTADVANGALAIPIYPAIVAPVGGNPVQYQTVSAAPANAAAVALVNQANEVYRKNIGFAPEAVTMVTADLVLPERGIVEGSRKVYDGVAMRMITAYNVQTDQLVTRLDVLYGYLFVRPEWAVIVADSTT